MGEGWGWMLSSSKDGTYRMCVARRKSDRLQITGTVPLYTFCLYCVDHIDCHIPPITLKKIKVTYVILLVSLPSIKHKNSLFYTYMILKSCP